MSSVTNSFDVSNDDPVRERKLAVLYQEHARSVLAFLKARLGCREDAEDVSQTVWCEVQRRFEQFDGGHFRGWVFSIARSRLIDHRRKQKRQPQRLEIEHDPADPTGEELDMTAQFDDRKQAFRDCLGKLSSEFRQAVEVRMQAEDYATISQRIGVPAATLMTRFHRSKAQLQDCVGRTLS